MLLLLLNLLPTEKHVHRLLLNTSFVEQLFEKRRVAGLFFVLLDIRTGTEPRTQLRTYVLNLPTRFYRLFDEIECGGGSSKGGDGIEHVICPLCSLAA